MPRPSFAETLPIPAAPGFLCAQMLLPALGASLSAPDPVLLDDQRSEYRLGTFCSYRPDPTGIRWEL